MDAIGLSSDVDQKLFPNEVNRSGAVSPAALAIASSTPVIIPLCAVLKTILKVVFHLGIPSASAASRNECGTSLSISSVILVIVGIINTPSANPPA